MYIFVNVVETLTSNVSASLFYRVRFQDGVHMSVELCHACAYFKQNCEHSIKSCNNRYTGKLQKKKTKPLKIVIHNYKHFYVPVKSKLQHPPTPLPHPPGQPPRAFEFLGNFLFKFPPPEAEKLLKCPIIDPLQVIKCPHPRETFR